MTEKLRSKDLIELLRKKYPLPAYALLEQLADGTGARQNRWADAIAMSVWPSRGYHLLGFEVKVSRSDWLKELQQPAKADALMQYCDAWYLVVGDTAIVQPGELPVTWGMMAPIRGGLAVVKEAPKLVPKGFSVELVASILRNVSMSDAVKLSKARAEGEAEGSKNAGDYARRSLTGLKTQVDAFEAASGIKITEYTDGIQLGEAVRAIQNVRWVNLAGAVNTARNVVKQLEALESVEVIQKLANEIKDELKPRTDSEV